jgi:cytochrome oxidase Cu insertion factor (SCO1/SenC/PrrC family)
MNRFARGRIHRFVLAMTGLVLAALGLAAWQWLRHANADRLEVYGKVPEFSLGNAAGRRDTCPLQSAHLARLQAELSGIPDVLFVSITVDPDHDSRAVLSEYAARFHAQPDRWLFVTGPRPAIYRLAVDGFHLAAIVSRRGVLEPTWAWMRPATVWAHDEPSGPKIIQLVHASRFALLDRKARIRGYFDGTDWNSVKRLSEDLRWLVGRP